MHKCNYLTIFLRVFQFISYNRLKLMFEKILLIVDPVTHLCFVFLACKIPSLCTRKEGVRNSEVGLQNMLLMLTIAFTSVDQNHDAIVDLD